MTLLIIKIGGCLITDKRSKEPLVNKRNINRIASELAEAYNNKKFSLIIIHGAGSFGHPIVKRTGIDKGIKDEKQLIDFAKTQVLQNELNAIMCNTLINHSLPAIPIQGSSSSLMNKKKLISMELKAIKGLLKLRLIPVLYGVPAFDQVQGCAILSGDQIITYLGKKLKASKLIFATDVNGVYTRDPKTDKNAKLIKLINKGSLKKAVLSEGVYDDVTGGMLGKINELIGFNAQIINGNIKGNIKRALLGEEIGSTIRLK